MDARYAIPMPADWDFETGAAYLVQNLTAYYGMTTLGGLQNGHNELRCSVRRGMLKPPTAPTAYASCGNS
jgi:hypothetical protein